VSERSLNSSFRNNRSKVLLLLKRDPHSVKGQTIESRTVGGGKSKGEVKSIQTASFRSKQVIRLGKEYCVGLPPSAQIYRYASLVRPWCLQEKIQERQDEGRGMKE
jgi:hypothetical protein